MQTFDDSTGWYGDTGARWDGLGDANLEGDVEITGACKLCGGGGMESIYPVISGHQRFVSYLPADGSMYCEVPDEDPVALGGVGVPSRGDLDAAMSFWGAGAGLVGTLAFDANQTALGENATGSTASFRLRRLYDTQFVSNFPDATFLYSRDGSGSGQFPPSRTAGSPLGSTCGDTGWLSFGEWANETPAVQQEFMFQGCLGTAAGYGAYRFLRVPPGRTGDNPFGGTTTSTGSSQVLLPVEGSNCYINVPPRFVTFCSCDKLALPLHDSTPAMGCEHHMTVFNTPVPFLPAPTTEETSSCCGDSGKMEYSSDVPGVPQNLAEGTFKPAVVRGFLNYNVSFFLTARDDDQCTELVVDHTGLPHSSMRLESYQRLDARTVTRKFVWEPLFDKETSEDLRPYQSVVCFYASDRYAITSLPFHCVEIRLSPAPPAPPSPPPPPSSLSSPFPPATGITSVPTGPANTRVSSSPETQFPSTTVPTSGAAIAAAAAAVGALPTPTDAVSSTPNVSPRSPAMHEAGSRASGLCIVHCLMYATSFTVLMSCPLCSTDAAGAHRQSPKRSRARLPCLLLRPRPRPTSRCPPRSASPRWPTTPASTHPRGSGPRCAQTSPWGST